MVEERSGITFVSLVMYCYDYIRLFIHLGFLGTLTVSEPMFLKILPFRPII